MALESFIFGGDTGVTPDTLKRRRQIAQALLERTSLAPRDVGEGLTAVGNALIYRSMMNKADAAEKAGQDSANSAFAPILSMLGGGSSKPGATVGSMPMADANGNIPPVNLADGDVYNGFMNEVKKGITNPYGLAAVAATGSAESGFSPENVNRTWSDPSESGKPGRAGGIMSWRGPRYDALAATGDLSPAGQAKFFLQEDPKLIAALNNAKSVEEAQTLMNNAWAFAGYDKPGGESARRLAAAQGYLPRFQQAGGGTEVASLDPSAGLPQVAPQPVTQPGYRDPMVSAPNYRPEQPAQTTPAPALPPPTTVSNPPVPPQTFPVVADNSGMPTPAASATQTASAPSQIPAGGGNDQDMQTLLRVSQNPWLTPGQRSIVNAMIEQRIARQQALYEQQLQQSDPKYRQDLEKGSIELENLRNPKMSPAEQAADQRDREKMAFEREKFDAEVKKGQWQKLTDGRLYNQTTGEFRDAPPPNPGSVPPKFDDVSSLRKEIQGLPSYKNLSQALPIYRSMAETAGRNSKASDLNLVYGLGKIMDPNSVVREGEMTMVKSTASWPDWLQGALASLNGGAALTPETRQAIMTEAYGRVQGYDQAFKQDAEQYRGIVDRNKFNPADVIPDFGTYEPWSLNPAAPPADDIPPAPEGVDAEDWKYLTPEQRRLWQK